MGILTPSTSTEFGSKLATPKSTFASIASIYLSRESTRTEQLNTVNAIIASSLESISSRAFEISSREECEEALAKYFKSCAIKNVRPTFSGMCNALGATRQQFIEACETGQVLLRGQEAPVSLPADVHDFFRSVREGYASMIEGFMETNAINASSGIFLLKNNCGYKETVDHNYAITQTVVDVTSFAEKYAQEIGE